MDPRKLGSLLGGLGAAEFLKRYWQKQPLLVRGAIPDFKDPLSVDELAGLAMEKGIHARLVRKQGWKVQHGPFKRQALASLPRQDWTLLVSNVDQWVEDAALLLDRFQFLPHWRLDDLMVSFAPPGGTVGPHVDGYDVFLVQGKGQRRWQIARRFAPGLVKNAELKVLASFKPEDDWVLNPGDLLYLPPGVAHYGVALEDCLTYSVGFRAPARRDLLADLFHLPPDVTDELGGDDLYQDPDLKPQASPGEITGDALARVAAMLRGPLDQPAALGRWFGALVTRPVGAPAPGGGRPPTAAALAALLASDRRIWRSDGSRFAYVRGSGEVFLYVDGEEHRVPAAVLPLIQTILASRRQSGRDLARALPKGAARRAGLALLSALIARGNLYLSRG